LIDDKKLIKKN